MHRALVIDDNIQNLKVLTQLLTRQGIEATPVSDPRMLAGQLGSIGAISIAFVDLEMPGMDGYLVKDLLRNHDPNMLIVACTVHVSEINVVKNLGFDGFIGKPLDVSRFPDQLRRMMVGEGVWERA